jgi:zinc/manganese transport system substrate-binding protein
VSLHTELKAKAATVPQDRRKLVTSHDAFPYLRRRSASRSWAVQPEPDQTVGAELANIETVKGSKVPAVFVETGVSKALTETLAKEAGVSKVVADLPTDSLLAPPADSYLGFMRVVMDNIVAALK